MSQIELRRGEDVDLGRVIRRGVAAVRADAVLLLPVALLFTGLPAFVYGLLRASGAVEAPGDDLLAALRGAPGETVVTFVLSAMFTGASIHAVLERFAGRSAGWRGMLSAGRRFLLPMLGLTILTGFGVGLGLILLIVPGVLLMTMWSVAGPARVAGRPGVLEALDRSVELTKGQRWRILGLIVLGSLAVFGVMLAAGALGAVLDQAWPGNNTGTELVATPLGAIASALVTNVGSAALFEELRSIKDGPNIDAVAEVFA